MDALTRLMQAAANHDAADWAARYYGRHLTSSTTTLYVTPAIYERLCRVYEELRAARKAALERAFL